MATDYKINLAKTLTSTPEERRKFYHGMLVYFVVCAAAMVYTAYFASVNLLEAHQANMQRSSSIKSVTSASGQGRAFYRDPDQAYVDLQRYAADVALLKKGFAQRSHFVPVIGHLFSKFPEEVALQELAASHGNKKISFVVVSSPTDQDRGDPVRRLQAAWAENTELGRLVLAVRPVTSERRMVGGEPKISTQFECILK